MMIMLIPGFFFLVEGKAQRGLCINRKSTFNILIVFIMQTAVNKLQKNLAARNTPKMVRKHDCRVIGLKQLKYCLLSLYMLGKWDAKVFC